MHTKSLGWAILLVRRGGAASPLLVNIDESELETGRPRPASGVGTILRAKPENAEEGAAC